jgi:hypothetical protein
MKKTHEKPLGNLVNINSEAKTLQSGAERMSNVRSKKKGHTSAVIYEEGDLRGIVVGAQAKSTDPYRALLESGVIKNAAEFFDGSD